MGSQTVEGTNTQGPDVGGWMCGWGAVGPRFLCIIIKDTKEKIKVLYLPHFPAA